MKISLPGKVLRYLALVIGALAVLFPIYILIVAAFKSPEEFGQTGPMELPQSFLYLDNFALVFSKGNFALAYANIGLIIVMTVIGNILIGTMLSYALQRFDFKLKKVIMGLYTLALIIPSVTTQVATYQVVMSLKLTNTLFSMVILGLGADLVQLYVYLQFLQHIPRELDEAASVEGASFFRIYGTIILPLLKPAIVTLAVIKVIGLYNDMYTPYLYMSSPDLAVVSTALMKFSSGVAAQWYTLSAAILLVMLPVVVLYLFLQKYIMAGIIDGAVKS